MRCALRTITTAAALAAASILPATAQNADKLPPAKPGMHCASGGRAIGEDIRNGYFITTVLEVRTRDKDRKIVGWIYSGSDGIDYLQRLDEKNAHQLGDGEISPAETMMVYCFSKPWMGK